MRRKLRIFREEFFKLAAFFILGAVLLWIYKKRSIAAEYISPEYIRLALIIALLLYLLYAISLIQSISHSGWLKRFDPGNPDSLNDLANMRRYKLPAHYATMLRNEGDELLETIHLYLRSRGFNEQIRRSFGLVYERKLIGRDRHLKERWQRVIVLYRPLLNVIVVDQMLKEAIDYIDRSSPQAKMNQYILLTDMENDQEVLSAAAGVVNFLGKLNNSYLSPILIDQHKGRLFFPSDRSLISLRQKIFHDFFRYDFVLFLRRERKEKLQSASRMKRGGRSKRAELIEQKNLRGRTRGPQAKSERQRPKPRLKGKKLSKSLRREGKALRGKAGENQLKPSGKAQERSKPRRGRADQAKKGRGKENLQARPHSVSEGKTAPTKHFKSMNDAK